MITLTGNTYKIRDLLKAKGAQYNAAAKSWTISQDAWDRISKLDHGKHVAGVVVNADNRAKAYDDLHNEGAEGYNPYR